MLPVTMNLSLERLLYRGRGLLAVLALIVVVYGNVYLWFYVPYGGPLFRWDPDAHLMIIESGDSALQSGDVVLAINGRRPQRMRPIYPLPLQPSYSVTVQRDREIFTTIVPVDAPLQADVVGSYLPATILSLAGWLAGAVMLLLARPGNRQALHAGAIFLLAAVVLSGVQAALEGAPGAWVGGYVLIFPLAVCWVYLAAIPRSRPISARVRAGFQLMFAVSGVLALTAVYEVLFLFPQATSVQELAGVSLYDLGFLLSALGLMTCVSVLVWRRMQLPPDAYARRQITILLFFMATAVLPTVLLTFIPQALFKVKLLPFPLAISLLILIPAGYLYVIYRKGFLGLDLFFGRTLYLLLLSLLVFGFYAIGLHLVQRLLLPAGEDTLLPAIVIFLPTLLLTVYAARPVNHFVQHLLYGRTMLDPNTLSQMAAALAAKPEMATLATIVQTLARLLNAPQALLLLADERGRPLPVGWVGFNEAPQPAFDQLPAPAQPALRASGRAPQPGGALFSAFSWAELLVPVSARGRQQGVLVLAAPGPDGFFNAAQVAFLQQAADILAVGGDNATLFEAARRLARQRLAVQEQERKQIAAQIHDDPLQRITYVTSLVDRLLAAPAAGFDTQTETLLRKADDHLREVATELRNICAGLHPPFHDQGVELTVKEITRQYTTEYDLTIETRFEPQRPSGAVSEVVTGVVHRVLVEALNNVVKHTRGARVWVTLQRRPAQLLLQITDDGPGIGHGELSFSELLRRQHLGLVGMHEWARLVQGELLVGPNSPRGTIISLSCPL